MSTRAFQRPFSHSIRASSFFHRCRDAMAIPIGRALVAPRLLFHPETMPRHFATHSSYRFALNASSASSKDLADDPGGNFGGKVTSTRRTLSIPRPGRTLEIQADGSI